VSNIYTAIKGAPTARRGLTAPGREQRERARAAEGKSGQGDPPQAAEAHPGVSPSRGGSYAASFGRKPYGAAAAAHGTPGDRPAAVPAVFRCRARQHHGWAVSFAPTAPEVVRRNSDRADAAHYPSRPLQPQRRASGAPLTPETSADPAGLTAWARPETRAANRSSPLKARFGAGE
jgi:hypothetical protein